MAGLDRCLVMIVLCVDYLAYAYVFMNVKVGLDCFMRLYSCKVEIGWTVVSLLKSWIEMGNWWVMCWCVCLF